MMGNLDIYNAVRTVPADAKKPITGGKLNGYTDINPMWRIRMLTEQFGVCGIGWKTETVNKETVPAANGEVAAFVDINLYVKVDGAWSEAIAGTGGSMLVQTEKGKLVSNDEAYKMAYTDAISVACKALGFGADVYWSAGESKYSKPADTAPVANAASKDISAEVKCSKCGIVIQSAVGKDGTKYTPSEVAGKCKGMCKTCYLEAQNES